MRKRGIAIAGLLSLPAWVSIGHFYQSQWYVRELTPPPARAEPRRSGPFLVLDVFTASATGYAGEFTTVAARFVDLVRRADRRRFVELVERGRPGGKLYGLCGLYLLGDRAFDRSFDHLSSLTDRVGVSAGCTTTWRPLSKELSGDFLDICEGYRSHLAE